MLVNLEMALPWVGADHCASQEVPDHAKPLVLDGYRG